MTPSDRQRSDPVPPLAHDLSTTRPVGAPTSDDAVMTMAVPPSDSGEIRPFTREPAPRRTQPAASVTSEDFTSENYAESTSYTAKSRRPLSGAGYRRSRHQAERLRRDLRYGQYLEVPKGQRTIFASQRRGMAPVAAALIAAAIIIVVIALIVLL